MTETGHTALITTGTLNPAVEAIVRHLCEGDCHAFGSVLQWCETRGRGECAYAVVCPSCSERFLIEEEDLAELERWTEANGHALVCGVQL